MGQRARDVDPLEHPSREVVGALALVTSEPEVPEEVPRGKARPPGDALGEDHVVHGALPGQHRGPLRHEAEQTLPPCRAGRLRADPDLAGRGRLEIGHDAEKGRLAAAGRTDEGHELAGADFQVHPIQRERLAEPAGDPTDRDRQHGIRLRSTGRGAKGRGKTSGRASCRVYPGQRLMPGLNPFVIISSAGTTRGI